MATPTPYVTPYDQFGASQSETFWACPIGCYNHQNNATAGVNDMFYLNEGSVSISGTAQATQFANQQVNFVWGYTTCTPNAGPDTVAMNSDLGAGESRGYTDAVPICPTMNTVSHTGTMTLGPGGLLRIWVNPSSIYAAAAYVYVGKFVLQLSAIDTSSSTSSPGTTTTTTQSSTNSISNTVSSTGTANGSGNSTNIPPITAVWGSAVPGASTSTSAGTGGGKNDSPSPTASQGVTIGGAVAGVLAAMLIGITIWVIYRRRSKATEAQEKSVEDASHIRPFSDVARPNISSVSPPAMTSVRPPSTIFGTEPPAYDTLSIE